ncbi:MAG: hypothetical protein F6J97_01865 [Leptolyngbya sp. SIO4C1]|nr:hypothetical protein [Leptolyngbya sp. SIO4C1]
MQIQPIRPTLLQVRMHALELATLVSAARWIIDGARGELPNRAIEQLRSVVADYDAQRQRSIS